jgi:hypothetical protein
MTVPPPAKQRWARTALIAFGPPLLALVVWLSVRSWNDQPAAVELREAGVAVASMSPDEAIETAEHRTGIEAVVPRGPALRGYQLWYVDSLVPGDPGAAATGVVFGYRRGSGAWFWVSQMPAGQLDIPLPLLDVETDVEGSQIWSLGPPSASTAGGPRAMQFIARSPRYDRIISFEGEEFPSERAAVALIESMLRQD